MRTANREQFVNHKAASRELREAMREYFGPGGMQAESLEEANQKMAACQKWYNNERKLITTGLTPQQMLDKGEGSKLAHPIEKAYGIVYDAIDYVNKRTQEGDARGLELLDTALGLDSENEEALYILCDILSTGKQPRKAAPYVEKLLEIGIRRPQVCLWKAQLLVLEDGGMGGKKLEEAAQYAFQAREMDPENFDATTTCAQLCYWLGNGEHIQLMQEMLRLDAKRAVNFMEKHFIWDKPLRKRSGSVGST